MLSNTGGHSAIPGPDLATRTGLADAFKATLMTRLRGVIQQQSSPISVSPSVMLPPTPSVRQTVSGEGIMAEEIRALEDMVLDLK